MAAAVEGHSARCREHRDAKGRISGSAIEENHRLKFTLEKAGFSLIYDGVKRPLARRRDSPTAFEVVMYRKMLHVEVKTMQGFHGAGEDIMAVLEAGETTEVSSEVQKGTLLNFHQRF